MSFSDEEIKAMEALYNDSEVNDSSGLVPAGVYDGVIDKAVLYEPREGRPAKFSLQVNLVGGGVVFLNYTLTAKGMPFLKSDMTTLEFNGGVKGIMDEGKRSELLDKIVKVTVKHKEYNGNMYANAYLKAFISDSIGGGKYTAGNDDDIAF